MSNPSSRARQLLTISAVYVSLAIGVFGFSVIRARMLAKNLADAAKQVSFTDKPFFSLTTNRTFAPGERAKLSASYRGVDHLDFRVYQVKDPLKFFKQLDNPHQMGENEKEQVSSSYRSRLALLERTHSLKSFALFFDQGLRAPAIATRSSRKIQSEVSPARRALRARR